MQLLRSVEKKTVDVFLTLIFHFSLAFAQINISVVIVKFFRYRPVLVTCPWTLYPTPSLYLSARNCKKVFSPEYEAILCTR